ASIGLATEEWHAALNEESGKVVRVDDSRNSHAASHKLERCGADSEAGSVVALDIGGSHEVSYLGMRNFAHGDHVVVNAETISELQEAVIVDMADHDEADVWKLGQKERQGFHDGECVPER